MHAHIARVLLKTDPIYAVEVDHHLIVGEHVGDEERGVVTDILQRGKELARVRRRAIVCI